MSDKGERTIEAVLGEFLREQEGKLSVRTLRQYDSVIQLLVHCLDGYGWNHVTKKDEARVAERRKAPGMEWKFCALFGPEHIVGCYDEFLGYFMVRKVVAGKDLMRAAGSVTKKLAAWLAEKGYIGQAEAREGVEAGAEAARDLPAAREIADALDEGAEYGPEDVSDSEEGHFSVTRREGTKLWVTSLAGGSLGPIDVPGWIAEGLKVGWRVSGVLGKVGRRWVFLEAWNVYPM